MTSIIKIAIDKPTGKLMHIDNASNGLSCNCECLKCSEKLEAIQGEIRTKHFRHYTNKECEGAQETALHELGKQILVEHTEIRIPKVGLISYTDPIPEKIFEKIRPDVTTKYEDQSVYFEIFVSNSVDSKKDLFIKEHQLRCVEIDLSKNRASTYEETKRNVLESVENKRIIFWEEEPAKQPLVKSPGCLLQLLILIIVLVGLNGWIEG